MPIVLTISELLGRLYERTCLAYSKWLINTNFVFPILLSPLLRKKRFWSLRNYNKLGKDLIKRENDRLKSLFEKRKQDKRTDKYWSGGVNKGVWGNSWHLTPTAKPPLEVLSWQSKIAPEEDYSGVSFHDTETEKEPLLIVWTWESEVLGVQNVERWGFGEINYGHSLLRNTM